MPAGTAVAPCTGKSPAEVLLLCGLFLLSLHLQVAMGQAIPDAELHRLSDLFNAVTRGLVAWPFLDIPFTPWNK